MHRQPKPYLPASHFEINMTQHLTKSDENYFYTHGKHIYIYRFVKIEIKDREEEITNPVKQNKKQI
jgi:hypothetical protein